MNDKELEAFMAQEIESLVAELCGYEKTVGDAEPSCDTSFAKIDLPDVKDDPLNSFAVGEDDTYRVVTAPPPLVTAGNGVEITPNVAWDVPIRPAEVATELDVTETLVCNASATDAAFRNFLNLTRSANASAKRGGNFAASLAYTIGEMGTDTLEGSPMAFAVRITAAKLAASQGATASAQPHDMPFNVHQTLLANVSDAERLHPDTFSVYLPSGLSAVSMAAAVSLLPIGGPGCYTWRYRAAQAAGGGGGAAAADPRGDFMPSVVRHLFGGGHNNILLVTERAVALPVVGGAALTYAALDGLENYYRTQWGGRVFDAAWRTTYAMAAVYVEPGAVADPAPMRPGENFRVYDATTAIDGVDLQGDIFTWTGPQGAHHVDGPRGRSVDVVDWGDERHHKDLKRAVWEAVAVLEGLRGVGYENMTLDEIGAHGSYRSPDPIVVDPVQFAHDWDDIITEADRLGTARSRLVFAGMLFFVGTDMARWLDSDPEDERDRIDDTTRIRNVFGAKDHAKLALPAMRIEKLVGLLALFHTPIRHDRVPSALNRRSARRRARKYAAHLHLLVHFAYVKRDIWPADLRNKPVRHDWYIMEIAPALRPACWMDVMRPDYYPFQNWQVLESSCLIRGARADTPFVGSAVAGVWPQRFDGVVKLNDRNAHYVAIEAAYKTALHEGGMMSANSLFATTHFAIIRNKLGMANPLPFAPRISHIRGTQEVTLTSDAGAMTFQNGANTLGPSLSVY